jgi:hypothetical protein
MVASVAQYLFTRSHHRANSSHHFTCNGREFYPWELDNKSQNLSQPVSDFCDHSTQLKRSEAWIFLIFGSLRSVLS